jgi:hypothetical protein
MPTGRCATRANEWLGSTSHSTMVILRAAVGKFNGAPRLRSRELTHTYVADQARA